MNDKKNEEGVEAKASPALNVTELTIIAPTISTEPSRPTPAYTVTIREKGIAELFATQVTSLTRPDLGPRLAFFCDGSWKTGSSLAGAGISYYKRCLDDGRQRVEAAYAAENYFDSLQAEFLGAATALRIALDEATTVRSATMTYPTIYLFTDSVSVLEWLKTFITERKPRGGKTDVEKHAKLLSLASKELARLLCLFANKNIPLEFHWVKGHSGVQGNRRADRLAGLARKWAESQEELRLLKKSDIAVKVSISVLQSRPHNTPAKSKRKRKAEEMSGGAGVEGENPPPKKKQL